MRNRWMAALIFLCCVALMVPLRVLGQETAEFAGGDGTANDPYLIATKGQLDKVRNHMDAHFRMISDISFLEADFSESGQFYNQGLGWQPIGTKERRFTGFFDGNGFEIKGLVIHFSGNSAENIGLFGCSSGTIQGLGLSESTITADSDTVTLRVGGIVGYISSGGTVRNCYNSSTVCSGNYSGGIAGVNWGTVESCYNTGNISGGTSAGGIVASNFKKVANCYNKGVVSAFYSGGISGSNSGSISACYNIGAISGSYRQGGIAGENSNLISVCYYDNAVARGSGYGVDPSVGCSLAQMQDSAVYSGFDFDAVWVHNTDSRYPFPVLQNTKHTMPAENTSEFAGGTGDAWNPYLIASAQQLDHIRRYPDAHYKMIRNISLPLGTAPEGWQPIGTKENPFSGTFDGDGHTVSGLTIQKNVESTEYLGLFGYASGKIKNLTIDGSRICITGTVEEPASNTIHVYIGAVSGFGDVENCHHSGEITMSYSSATQKAELYAGGIIGSGSAAQCGNSGSVSVDIPTSGSSYVYIYAGGIAGKGDSINNCVNTGAISASSSRGYYGTAYVGGIAGMCSDIRESGNSGPITLRGSKGNLNIGGVCGCATDDSLITRCYNTGSISAGSDIRSGGIVGYIAGRGTVTDSFNIGIVDGGWCGGIVGRAHGTADISNCYNAGMIEAGNSRSAILGSATEAYVSNCYSLDGMAAISSGTTACDAEEMQQKESFAGFDFSAVWQIGVNSNFPWPELRNAPLEKKLTDISECDVQLDKDTYQYHTLQPVITVTHRGQTLVLNEDYALKYVVGENTWRGQRGVSSYLGDIGEGKIYIVGMGEYFNVRTVPFSITKFDISNAELHTQWVPDENGCLTSGNFTMQDFTYDGTPKIQSGFRICDDNDDISSDNYQISYQNNVHVGTATMIITGTGDFYTGSLKKTFEIHPGELSSPEGVTRVFGADRYATSFKAADTLKEELGVEKFQNIVVASGTGFADALAGSYLAAVKNAPILLVRGANVNDVKNYIKQNLTAGGTVYLLGGVNAVPKAMESGLDGFNVKRLGGANRYDTNLLILQEAGVGDKDIIVCTGLNFADSLSASATGLPILLVKDGLYANQKEFLTANGGNFIIVGGNNAVNATVEKQLASYGSVKRLAGNTRYDTSVLVAKEFFDAPTSAVLAYAQNFPDGLSGGPLAYALNAPLILTDNNKPTAAVTYATGLSIKSGYVLGGTGLISDRVVKNVFTMASGDSILTK